MGGQSQCIDLLEKSFAESRTYIEGYERERHKASYATRQVNSQETVFLLFKQAHSSLVLVGKEVDCSVPT